MESTLVEQLLAQLLDSFVVLLNFLRSLTFAIRLILILLILFHLWSRIPILQGFEVGRIPIPHHSLIHLYHFFLDFGLVDFFGVAILKAEVDAEEHKDHKQEDVLIELRNCLHGYDPERSPEADARDQDQDDMVVHKRRIAGRVAFWDQHQVIPQGSASYYRV